MLDRTCQRTVQRRAGVLDDVLNPKAGCSAKDMRRLCAVVVRADELGPCVTPVDASGRLVYVYGHTYSVPTLGGSPPKRHAIQN